MNHLSKLFFWLCAVLLVSVHLRVFVDFNMVYIDTDQPNLWMAAKDYAQGLFYEPRYYGQAYNTCMESLVAVPFMWAGVPVYYAVPLATHLIFLFPFFYVGCYLYRKGWYWNAGLVLAVSLCFPNSFDLLNALPRGFVTGIFFTGFFISSIFYPQRLGLLFSNTVLAVLAYFVNPNSILISGPVLFYLFLHNYERLSYYLWSAAALLSYAPFYYLFDYFYAQHPDYEIHRVYFDTKLSYFLDSFVNLDERFAHVSPFVQHNCLPLLLLFVGLGILFWRWDKKVFGAFMIFLLIILLSFSNLRTRDGDGWIFFSMSRVYLGIPMALCLFLSTHKIDIRGSWRFLLGVPLLFTLFKFYTFNDSLQRNLKLYRWFQITALKLDDTLGILGDYKTICHEQNVDDIFVSSSFWLYCILPYGGPSVFDDFPRTELIYGDRRYWLREDRKNSVFPRFLFISGHAKLETMVNKNEYFELTSVDQGGIYLVQNNKLTKQQFFARISELEKEISRK